MENIIPIEHIQSRILVIRGHRVILDNDLAEMYGVTTKRLNQQVKRNQERFPDDFMFQLTDQEFSDLRSQFATANLAKRRYPPYVFCEHGAIMAASVLNSAVAMKISVLVVRAFVQMRNYILGNKELAASIKEIEKRLDEHDESIYSLIDTIRTLMVPTSAGNKIGFIKNTE